LRGKQAARERGAAWAQPGADAKDAPRKIPLRVCEWPDNPNVQIPKKSQITKTKLQNKPMDSNTDTPFAWRSDGALRRLL